MGSCCVKDAAGEGPLFTQTGTKKGQGNAKKEKKNSSNKKGKICEADAKFESVVSSEDGSFSAKSPKVQRVKKGAKKGAKTKTSSKMAVTDEEPTKEVTLDILFNVPDHVKDEDHRKMSAGHVVKVNGGKAPPDGHTTTSASAAPTDPKHFGHDDAKNLHPGMDAFLAEDTCSERKSSTASSASRRKKESEPKVLRPGIDFETMNETKLTHMRDWVDSVVTSMNKVPPEDPQLLAAMKRITAAIHPLKGSGGALNTPTGSVGESPGEVDKHPTIVQIKVGV